MQKRLITKVSIAKGTVIEYKKQVIKDKIIKTEGHSLESDEEGTQEFYTAIQSFVNLFIESAGLDSEYWQDAEITRISLEHSDAGTAIAFSGRCKVNEKYVTVPSPSRIVYPEYEYLLEELYKQAFAYLDGKRSQQSLFDTAPAPVKMMAIVGGAR